METYNGLPLYILDVNMDDNSGIEIISLVDMPAIQEEFLAFAEEMEVKLSLDDDKHIVSGPALIPNKKIYREVNGTPFYVEFSREAIERMAEKFFAQRNNTNVNLNHKYDVDDCVYFESYLTNKERGICPKEYADLPDGTWMVSCKINNPNVWECVKKGVLRGFSIEGDLIIKPKDTIDTLEDLINVINDK